MNNMSNMNCTTVGSVKPTIATFSVFSVAATLFYVATIGIIFKQKLHRHFIHRLSLYLALGGLLRALAIWISIMPVDIQQPDGNPVSVREGWNGFCSFGGFLNQYTSFIQTFIAVWLSVYIFCGVVCLKQLTQLKYELAGLVTVVLGPLLLTWEPFISTTYGLSETICYIETPSCNPIDATIASYYVAFLTAVPQIILTLFGLFMVSIAMISMLRKICLKYYERHYWLAIKEILPLMLFPVFYSLVYVGRMLGLLIDKDPLLVIEITVVLTFTCSVLLPVSLLVRPGIRRSLCRGDAKYEDEEIAFSNAQYHCA